MGLELERALLKLGGMIADRDNAPAAPVKLFGGTCRVRQYSDTMQCECGLQYDTNDCDPPRCPATLAPAPENGAARRA